MSEEVSVSFVHPPPGKARPFPAVGAAAAAGAVALAAATVAAVVLYRPSMDDVAADLSPQIVAAEPEPSTGTEVWWSARITVHNVETHYRWLLSGGAFDYVWLTAGGIFPHDVPDASDFVVSATAAPPSRCGPGVPGPRSGPR